MDNCDFWADVDFGRGPVEIRCTIKGPHSRHMCVVEMGIPEPSPPQIHAQHNVFNHDLNTDAQ